MKFRIEMRIDGAAFEPSPSFEIRRILEHFVRVVEPRRGMEPVTLRDINGTKIGMAEIVADEGDIES